MKRRPHTVAFLSALLPPVIWYACFSALYAAATLACDRVVPADVMWNVSFLLFAAMVVALAFVAVRTVTADPFLTTVKRWLSLLAILAMCWTLVPLVMLRAC